MEKFTRREFLLNIAAGSAALALHHLAPGTKPAVGRPFQPESIPLSRVVHVHNYQATFWDYSTGWYGDYVNQAVVDQMTDRGLMDLTGAFNLADAWRVLIPEYISGQKVAIKINLNNASCYSDGQVIDALPQPVNSVIRGLKAIGVAEGDICVYDCTQGWHLGEMPQRLAQKITAIYPGVQFSPPAAACSPATDYSGSEYIHFNVPPDRTISDRPICNALVNATYLINVPIMKKHGMAGVTLGFKNHFGSFDGCDQVHWSIELGDPGYLSSYNGLVDIYQNRHFKDKTVLTIGDALYGARFNNYDEVPNPWPTFGDHSPNSLFFSRDPVAIDCVMYDFLDAEGGVPAGSDDYLKLASTSGFGTFEHRDASQQYHIIDYRRIDLPETMQRVFLPLITSR